ncbi:hypothetical protein D8L93_09995 [Sodalis-like symbiont of Bactericera trigonica]|nr:hypothetical protein D8L93_09995 [Sodalis-like symbiont of Bactericera trigonica]
MSWLAPEVIDILLTVVKAVVILLVVVTCGAYMSFAERRLLAGLVVAFHLGRDERDNVDALYKGPKITGAIKRRGDEQA